MTEHNLCIFLNVKWHYCILLAYAAMRACMRDGLDGQNAQMHARTDGHMNAKAVCTMYCQYKTVDIHQQNTQTLSELQNAFLTILRKKYWRHAHIPHYVKIYE